jgi:26 proteasome complex subunit DSS1
VIDALAKAGKSPGDNLWEANWDDDDIEDDFTKQLRWVSDLLGNHVFSIEAA